MTAFFRFQIQKIWSSSMLFSTSSVWHQYIGDSRRHISKRFGHFKIPVPSWAHLHVAAPDIKSAILLLRCYENNTVDLVLLSRYYYCMLYVVSKSQGP